MEKKRPSGTIAAVATPLRKDGDVDGEKLVDHCRWLLENGCTGINLLGTTGEATSLSLEKRLAAMEHVAGSGLPVETFLVGTGAAALADAARLTSAARDLCFGGALLLPPFYYKGIGDEDLEHFIESVIAAVGERDLRLYLYNFPQMTGLTYSAALVARLRRKRPATFRGLKDSSGDLAYSAALARDNPGFDVFPSSETTLDRTAELGTAGCISATLNVTAPLAAEASRRPDAGAVREALGRVPLVPAVKWALAELFDDPSWRIPLPPLRPISPSQEEILRRALASTAFDRIRKSDEPVSA